MSKVGFGLKRDSINAKFVMKDFEIQRERLNVRLHSAILRREIESAEVEMAKLDVQRLDMEIERMKKLHEV